MRAGFLAGLSICIVAPQVAQAQRQPPSLPALTGPVPGGLPNESSFRKIESWPTPTETRTGSGAPGHRYWQQKVDYKIKAELDDATQTIKGTEQITYRNNSPDELRYLWLQMDQNILSKDSVGAQKGGVSDLAKVAGDDKPGISLWEFNAATKVSPYEGHKVHFVKDAAGRDLKTRVVDTMMKVELAEPLKPGQSLVFNLGWDYRINNYKMAGGRSGFEQLEDGARLYNIAQWQPRLVAYMDDMGWQHQQYLGQGEFTLEFGDWDVEFTLPADQVVLATGELQNPQDVLTAAQRERLAQARRSAKPLFIVKPEEAGTAAARPKTTGTSTWKFKANNVRDFALASSKRLIWDAQGVDINGRNVLAMSGYTKEGLPLWDKYSTAAVAHTLKTYGRFTFDYPYPVAISVLGGQGGMEYPMLCFNGPRPEKDGTYSERTKLGLVGVIIHEVGHNFFPMIVNSDERQWSWMDEGLNTFLQHLSEREWDPAFPRASNASVEIADYLKFPNATPIMTQSDAVRDFNANAYQKPAAGLHFLRETVLGRELFDEAFKEYARRWKFKRPQPADFFRTLQDASGVDLDWFWRGWFYTTAAPDLALENVEAFKLSSGDPEAVQLRKKAKLAEAAGSITQQRNQADIPAGGEEQRLGLQDFYTDGTWDRFAVTEAAKQKFESGQKALSAEEKAALASGKTLYRISIRNVGRFVMPIILKCNYGDGSSEVLRLPVQAWMQNEARFAKLIARDKELVSVELDPFLEIPDVDRSNDAFPRRIKASEPLRLMRTPPRVPNPMQEKAKPKENEPKPGAKPE